MTTHQLKWLAAAATNFLLKPSPSPHQHRKMPPPEDDGGLFSADTRLFESGNFADATIVCEGRTWKVHKLILSSRCRWFKAAFYGNMAEAASGQVVLHEQDPDVVDIMLRYIYDRGQETNKLRSRLYWEGAKDTPVLCVRLFRLADFFLLDEMVQLARKGLRSYLDRTIRDLDRRLDRPMTWAKMHSGKFSEHDDGMSGFSQTLTGVSEAIRDSYKDNSTEQLREMLLSFFWMRNNMHFQTPQTIDLLNEIPALGKDLMKVYLSVNPMTDRHDRLELPRPLVIVGAVRRACEEYDAHGYLRLQSWTDEDGHTCVLRPEPDAGHPFRPVYGEYNQPLDAFEWLVPYAPTIVEIGTHEESTIVSVTRRINDPPDFYIRFPTPEDARHYVQSYRNARPEIKEKDCEYNKLWDGMRTADFKARDYERIEREKYDSSS